LWLGNARTIYLSKCIALRNGSLPTNVSSDAVRFGGQRIQYPRTSWRDLLGCIDDTVYEAVDAHARQVAAPLVGLIRNG